LNHFINYPTNILPNNLTDKILRNSHSLPFHLSIACYQASPILPSHELASKLGVKEVWVKDESTRFGLQAFKGLGASYAISELLKKQPTLEIFCTATDGNHGRAVAWSAKQAGKKAVVFVPKDTTAFRMQAIEKEGATVIKIEGNYDETCKHAAELSEKEGWQLVQDTAWSGYEEIPALIMAGYLTHFIELESSLHTASEPSIDFVFLQAGVGSWAASAAWYYNNRYANIRPKLIIVEPTASDGILQSFIKGGLALPSGNQKTIMAGLNCGIPSLAAWSIIKNCVDASMIVEDHFAKQAMRALHNPIANDPQIIAGESGVGGLAGFIALMTDERFANLKKNLGINESSRVLFYNTEGATDPESYKAIVQ
jgi:diaminopropionate ammonia-lyase